MIDKITWLGHATFKISGDKLLYIDPWKIAGIEEAGIILVSHSHYDHYSQDDIDKLIGPETVIVTVPELKDKIGANVKILRPGEKIDIDDISIEAVPAYNVGKQFHRKESGWIGFLIEMGGERLYYAGDTDAVPEMYNLHNIDVALLPVGGTYTMSAEEAAEAAEKFKPGIVVPYHWGDIIGSEADARKFESIYGGKTVILKPEK